MKQLQLKLYGNIQGVGFRYWVKTQARALGITGFVRNEPDGTVKVLVQGDTQALEKFLKVCYDGPNFAQVTHVTPEWEEITERFTSFDIL